MSQQVPRLANEDVAGWVRRFVTWLETSYLRQAVTRTYVDAEIAKLERRIKVLEGG